MADLSQPSNEGLRERKRRATENAIELAATQLALELGFETATVEQISDRANVSRSTFFNYFPTREAAIIGKPVLVLTGASADAVLGQFPDNLPKGIFALFFASVGHANVNTEVARLRQEITNTYPEARRAASAALVEVGEDLGNVATDWLLEHPELRKLSAPPAREATLAVHVVYAAVTVLAESWADGGSDITAGFADFDAAVAELDKLI